MEKKYGFTLLEPTEFDAWIKAQNVARTVLYIQQHHTYIPAYEHFKGNNHFELQRSMQNVHTVVNGWMDIAQHFTIFPDGRIATGRSLEKTPAGILGFNAYAICIESIGNFDTDGDVMRQEQRNAIIKITASLAKRFNIPVNTDRIVYHHWFDLGTGVRTNGTGATKSCPGTGFFGGNNVADAQKNLLPQVQAALQGIPGSFPALTVKMYGTVTATSLNIRNAPSAAARKINAAAYGAVLRIYETKNGWHRISATKQEWVYGIYVARVERGTVNTANLNVRSGPGAQHSKVGALFLNQEVFVYETIDTWVRISEDQNWVSRNYLTFS